MARQGAIDSPPKTPFIMGSECAGDIEQIGEGVENFKVSINEPETFNECIKFKLQVCSFLYIFSFICIF